MPLGIPSTLIYYSTITVTLRKTICKKGDCIDFPIVRKSLKSPKGQSKSSFRRKDNIMAKRKTTEGQTMFRKIVMKI